MKFKTQGGFSLIELLIVIVVLLILAGISVPVYINYNNRAKEAATKTDMSNIATALELYKSENERYPSDFNGSILKNYNNNYNTTDSWNNNYVYTSDQDDALNYSLVSYGINEIEGGNPDDDIVFENAIMTSMGKYASINSTVTSTTASPTTTTKLTPLGNTFSDITGSIIDLIQDYYDKNNKYPRTWGDYVYTDIGLVPGDWKQFYDHVYYSPGGNRVSVKPEIGYIFEVTDLSGNIKILKPSYNWSLVYSMTESKWYYHTIDPLNIIDISTLKVKSE